MTRADLDKQPRDVARMFDAVAERYDLMNRLMTFGQEPRWRRAVTREIGPTTGMRVLDLAAGTGVSSAALAAPGAVIVACDFSLGMLGVGRPRHPEVSFVAGDALRLPFADAAYDVVTVSFGLRNVSDVAAALREMLRVTRPGGRLFVLETSTPTWRPFRAVHARYLATAMPRIARLASSNPDAYTYLAESMQAWPTQPELAGWIAAAGWEQVGWRNLTGGIVCVHCATRPG